MKYGNIILRTVPAEDPVYYEIHNTGLFKIIVGVLTTCHTQYI